MQISLTFIRQRYAQSTFLLLVFALIAGIFPVLAQEVVNRFDREGRIWLEYDDRVATITNSRVVPAQTLGINHEPEYFEVKFDRWIDGDLGQTSDFIRLYRVADFDDVNYSRYFGALDYLNSVLDQRPLLPTNTIYGDFVRFIDFENGSGVAYRAGYGETKTYQFQGITNDGLYYLSVQFILGAEFGLPIDEPEDFSTTLRMLDDVFASLMIDVPEVLVESDSTASTTTVQFENIGFEYASSLAWRVEGDVIAPIVDLEGVSMFGSQPGATQFSFPGFPDQNMLRESNLRVITVAEVPENANSYFEYVDELQALLEQRLDFASDLNPQDGGTAALLNRAERFMARPQYIEFDGGLGIRYLTYFSQGTATAVPNNKVYYVFEGMTDDGAHVITAVFPLTNAFPGTIAPLDPSAMQSEELDVLYPDYPEYLTQIMRGLEAQPASDFTPNLDTMDAMFRSLRVG
ncbi:MAG: hypothetical protein H7175_20025 [Burkholderiales bacterium]|nr:hypothetical protein [Anaerolineae bacterium]